MFIRTGLKLVSRLKHNLLVKRNMATAKEIVKGLQSWAPLSLAESWDNVGLLVDPMQDEPVKTVLLTNDLTEDVVDEAVKKQVGLIVSYHPNIFQGLKSVSDR